MHRHRGSVWRGRRKRTFNGGRINAQDQTFSRAWSRQILDEDLLQHKGIHFAILERFIQTMPLTLEEWRKRQFGEGLGLRFADESIDRIEQGIFGSAKTRVDVVTKLLECAKIHASEAPRFFWVSAKVRGLGQNFHTGQSRPKP